MRALPVSVVLLLGFASVLSADPFVPTRVAADARWVAHVDFDALRTAKTAQPLRQMWLNNELVKNGLQKIREAIGMDLSRDLHGVTVYGHRYEGKPAVAVVHADVDLRRLASYLEKLPDYRAGAHRNHPIGSWTQGKGTKHEHTVFGAVAAPGVILFGRSVEQLEAGLDVLDGEAPSLAGDSPLAGDAPPGTILLARGRGLSDDDVPFRSPIVRLSQRLSIAAGEHGAEAFAQAELVARSGEVATQIRDVVQGFRALAKLQHGDDEDTKRFLDAIEIKTDEQKVTVAWRGPGEEVLKLIIKEWLRRHKSRRAE